MQREMQQTRRAKKTLQTGKKTLVSFVSYALHIFDFRLVSFESYALHIFYFRLVLFESYALHICYFRTQ